MAFKVINATEAKPGVNIIIGGAPCIVRSQDISKTGKHGHAKARIEAVGILDNKKRVIVVPGHEKMEVPHIEKRKAQVMSFSGEKASIMDLESYETLDIKIEEGLEVREEGTVEYWTIGGEKIIKRTL